MSDDESQRVSTAVGGGHLPNDILQLVAAKLPSRTLAQARLVCKEWSRSFIPKSRTLYVQQAAQNTRRVLAILPSLGEVILRDLGNHNSSYDALRQHLSILATQGGSALTKLVLEQRSAPRPHGPVPSHPVLPFPFRLLSLDLASPGTWGRPLLQGLAALHQLTHLKLNRVSRSELLRVVPWRAWPHLRSLELHLSADDDHHHNEKNDGGNDDGSGEGKEEDGDSDYEGKDEYAPGPGGCLSRGSGAVAASAADDDRAGAGGRGWAETVSRVAAQLPALSRLRVAGLANPADEPRVAALLQISATALHATAAPAAASLGSGSSVNPIAAFSPVASTLECLQLEFSDADDDCDYVCCARITFGSGGYDGWRGAASAAGGHDSSSNGSRSSSSERETTGRSVKCGDAGGRRHGAGSKGGAGAGCDSAPRYEGEDGDDGGCEGYLGAGGCTAGVELGVHVMVVANDSDSGISNTQASNTDVSSSSSGSSSRGRSRNSKNANARRVGCGRRSRSARTGRRGRSSRSGSRASTSSAGEHEPGARSMSSSSDRGGGGGPSGNRGMLERPQTDVGRTGQTPVAADVSDDVTAAISDLIVGLLRLQLPQTSADQSITTEAPTAPSIEPHATGPAPLAAASGRMGAPAAAPPRALAPANEAEVNNAAAAATAAGVAVTSLRMVLCCGGGAGSAGGRALALDLSGLPRLRCLGLRLFSDTATSSFVRGCELRLQGLAELTSLRLMRSDGAAPPPELGGRLLAAL